MLVQVQVWKDNEKHCNIPVDVIQGRPEVSLCLAIPAQVPFFVFANIHQWIKGKTQQKQYGPWQWAWEAQPLKEAA